MDSQAFLRELELTRRDLASLHFHWTRRTKKQSARDVLHTILLEERLLGSSAFILGGQKCVCFTEAPITEMAALLKLLQSKQELPRYEPYGIAVRKRWLFESGGRPVIYQPREEGDLPASLRWRHCTYDPHRGVDFMWEREWRVNSDKLDLDRRQTLVIVPTADEAFKIMNYFIDNPTDGPAWFTTPLSFLRSGEAPNSC